MTLKLPNMQSIQVGPDISGGVRIQLGQAGFVMSPKDAIQYGIAVLRAAGCNVDLNEARPALIVPPVAVRES